MVEWNVGNGKQRKTRKCTVSTTDTNLLAFISELGTTRLVINWLVLSDLPPTNHCYQLKLIFNNKTTEVILMWTLTFKLIIFINKPLLILVPPNVAAEWQPNHYARTPMSIIPIIWLGILMYGVRERSLNLNYSSKSLILTIKLTFDFKYLSRPI